MLIDRKAGETLGLTIPQFLLAKADKVIQLERGRPLFDPSYGRSR
jgi:hypothetical protein